jgi:Mg2+ and Co2+ transporter CorA
MLEKMFNVINSITIDIKSIETKVFDGNDSTKLVKNIMIQKRNIIILKHMFKPQTLVLRQLESIINEIYS